MKIKSLTKAETIIWLDDTYNKLYGLDELLFEAQMNRQSSRTFSPPMILPKKVSDFFKSSPYNYAITETNLPNQMVSITKIEW